MSALLHFGANADPLDSFNATRAGYHYSERVAWCPTCGRETVHWRETSIPPLVPPERLLERVCWLLERVTCEWFCRRCTREIRLGPPRTLNRGA